MGSWAILHTRKREGNNNGEGVEALKVDGVAGRLAGRVEKACQNAEAEASVTSDSLEGLTLKPFEAKINSALLLARREEIQIKAPPRQT